MSKYAQTTTELKEDKYLVEALCEMGYHPEVHPGGFTILAWDRIEGGKFHEPPPCWQPPQ